jgi:hypothetical protein
MSTQATLENDPTMDPNYIPADEEVSSGGSDSWRISQGAIVRGRGRPRDPGFAGETREKIVGRLQDIHLYETTDDKGRSTEVLSATIRTATGEEIVKVKLSQVVAANTFAYGLTVIKAGDLIRLTASAGKAKDGEEPPTYANWAFVNPVTKATTNINEPRVQLAPGQKYNAKAHQATLVDKIKALPHFKGVPEAIANRQREDAAPTTQLAALSDEAERKGWPRVEVRQDAWLGLLARCGLGNFSAIGFVTDEAWGQMRRFVADLPAGTPVPPEFSAPVTAAANPLMGGYDPSKEQ